MLNKVNKSALFVGFFPNPVTGQSIALLKAWEGYEYEKYKIDNKISSKTHRKSKTSTLLNAFLIFKDFSKNVFKIIKVFRLQRPDIVYLSISRTLLGSLKDLPVLILARIYSTPVINHLQGADFILFFSSIPYIFKPVYYFYYSSVSKYIVLTEGMRNEISSVLGKRIEISVIPNFYDSIMESYNFEELKIGKSKEIEITYLSNILYSKGILYLIDAFNDVNIKLNYKLRLNIAGEIMEDSFMSKQEMNRKLNEKINDNIHIKYLGIVSGKEKAELLLKSNIFVLPTFYPTEAQPLAIIEALRMGCYIISTKHNYIPEFINSSHGELIDIKSVEAIEASILNYLSLNKENKEKIMFNNIIYASENFSLSKYQQRINNILENI